ncbi:uncharacterized protein LOC108157452 isoform X2 [Drosophila miranda]|uniref:uncharacterized protein LOC108157452 isoform X2 n=1 Tax=Drosophila miranda TaxID=7229 RepID=UPI0007E76647|nr:uncharacterized protein LOC108157452 isoform X2 [Drosophila miranda]
MADIDEKPSKIRSSSTSSIRYNIAKEIYPKQLLTIKAGPIKDELGFTLCERVALRQAWNLIRSRERRFGQDVFYTFLNEWYWSISKFKQGEDINIALLHGHALTFIRFVGALINESDPIMFQMLGQALMDYILKVLDKVRSPSLEQGLQRIVEKFKSYQDIQMDRSRTSYRRGVSKSNFSLHQIKTEK